ncbi:isocitrate lyase/PEP mutase family protein [Actinophytocola oryzae]|uniref:2-methylisocitrate lyase-like PEP mutase family enzyme n=1 Tax=Actinophytocola oryzae TaxID=502181 RepID=A0A4R7VYG0_9PSEU|nr:isocitrate lyase/phosphoenolpyruvate mutase family protein [Actinophytocola oryzae]TDV55104.1 2-methylisocitrate lyase-like PEP mutase family enzyme [Actinophytocola oryzae]
MTAALLRSLHVPGRPLVLPNVWDAGTARLVVEAGFPVVATSSLAVAESLGHADHQAADVDEMFAAARRITRAVDVPVTVDAEAGYGLPPAELAARLLDVGAVGCNLEDTDHVGGGLVPADRQADYLAAVRAAAGQDLVINARVDVFLSAKDQDSVLEEGISRARAYLAAGADCVYPILLGTGMKAFVDEVGAPVNAMKRQDLSIQDLTATGVARISLAAVLWRRLQATLLEELRVVRDPQAE